MYMNSTEQSSNMTQTAGETTEEGRRADWIDLSGHESLTPPLTVVTETNTEDSAEDSSSDSAPEENEENNSEDESQESGEEGDKGESEDENEESSEEECEEEECKDINNTIPGDWVCIVYGRD